VKPSLLIVNPRSRRGAAAADRIADALRQLGLPLLHRPCNGPAAIDSEIRRQAGEVDRVIIGGGDGTLNGAAAALLATGLPLGIIPLGTANDLARTLAIPADPLEAAQVIAAGHQHRIDIGEVNGRLFFNVASVGFGVKLTQALTGETKRRWGTLGYALAAVKALRRMRPFTVEILHGGQRYMSRTVHVAVGNGRHYGGGMTVSDTAEIDDNRLHVYSLEVTSAWQLLRLLPALRSGRHDAWTEIRTFSGQDIHLSTRRPRSVNTDGEITCRTPARIHVRPRAISVFVPRSAAT
jgi:diacylglycerol kinase (ATP)